MIWLGLLPDPSTFEGAVAVGLIVTLVGAAAIGGWKWLRARPGRRGSWRPLGVESQIVSSPEIPSEVADLATGLGQAIMAVRDAIEHFERYGVLVDPDHGTLASGGKLLEEARRTIAEAEARLPGARLVHGELTELANSAVIGLRDALAHVRDYIEEPQGPWSTAELEAARSSLRTASEDQTEFLTSADPTGARRRKRDRRPA